MRAGFSAIESLFRANATIILPAVIIGSCPRVGGRYECAHETASRIVAAGPRFLAGSEVPWILTPGTPLTRDVPRDCIPPVQLPDPSSARLPDSELRIPDLPLRNMPLEQEAGPSLRNPPSLPSVPVPVTGDFLPRSNEFSAGTNHGWSLLTASLKIA